MDETQTAGGVAAADLDGSGSSLVAGFDREHGADRVPVRPVLAKLDPEPVAGGAYPILEGGAGVSEKADRLFAIDHGEIEQAVEIEIRDDGATASPFERDARSVARPR